MLDREKRENKATKRRGSIYGENTVTNNKSSRVDHEENACASKSFDKHNAANCAKLLSNQSGSRLATMANLEDDVECRESVKSNARFAACWLFSRLGFPEPDPPTTFLSTSD
ncbi:uncharacterized protein LOC117236923 [Bombus vosnesenskii]|uniref:Uncharacterized protein LOC117236923 n=1 Tax=Bombus vosnesenskii TaxID=207650 RepID=A0A6J3KS89_9HYME|nr:uncharacterized protein LOC117157605 [Bombus vancouverensis nearcticus]XP_033356228.1 uncharacterized protein LOC117236923 [Bombus vosnesenskii]